MTPTLTLNLGLRWDYFTPYAEIHGRQANFIAAGNGTSGTYYISKKGCAVPRASVFDALLASSNITLSCVSDLNLGEVQKTNFAPRVGFAYRLLPTMVVRGGYGIAYGSLGNLGYGGTLGIPGSVRIHPDGEDGRDEPKIFDLLSSKRSSATRSSESRI